MWNCEIWNMFKVNNKNTRATPGVVLLSLWLTLNTFHTLFKCFYYYKLWAYNCRLGRSSIRWVENYVHRSLSSWIHSRNVISVEGKKIASVQLYNHKNSAINSGGHLQRNIRLKSFYNVEGITFNVFDITDINFRNLQKFWMLWLWA